MTSQKCQLRLGQKNTWPSHNGHVQNNLSKMIRRFILRLSKMGFFLPKILVKKIGFLIMHYGFRIVGVFSGPFSEALSLTTDIFCWYMLSHYGGLCPIYFSKELGFYGSVFTF
jgi:hypothetical protein